MPPRRNPRRNNNNETPIPPPPPPPPQFDVAMFQAAVTAAVAAPMSYINTPVPSGSGTGAPLSNHGESHGHPRECTYKDFTNAKPRNFNGTGGVMILRQWIEKTEAVFEICGCPENNKVKFATCTFSERALTWWNGHVKSLTLIVANSISWENLKAMLMREYCPRGLCDMAILCPDMVALESKKIERYIWGLSPQIQSSVLASRPVTFDSAKELAQSIIDHGNYQNPTITTPEQQKGNNNNNKKKGWNKRKSGTSQESSKRQHLLQSMLPRRGHTARFCKTPARPIAQVPNAGVGQACYGCGEVGHYKRNFPKAGIAGGVGRVLAIGHEEAVADPTVAAGTFLLDNSYACILFDSGAEKSFVNQKFTHLLRQKPCALDEPFTIEMANGKTESTNCIYVGCTLTLDDHTFKIDLMPVPIKSFDVIIGMNWLSHRRVDIMCFEKAVRLNLPNSETLVIYGDKPSTNLHIISCIQAQKCLRKENHAFLAHIVDTSQEVKDIQNIPEVRDFPDIFPEELPGLPPQRQVEFRIDLVPRATPVAKSPYRLAPTETQELSSQLNELLKKGSCC
ncbi:unnamed protein product [Lactuca virosa]|uniref:CCHC-type domain-containing protein n=1 Tax=Lactuca virosa TaxID=75947 RepID=A0AAU9NQC2_9ASTR|nr:unnamed protein product [Lactuca virosa]